MDIGQTESTVVALGRSGEAGGVEVLVRLKALTRIACDKGDSGLVRRAVDLLVSEVQRTCTIDTDRLVAAVLIMVGTALRDISERRPRSVLFNSGEAFINRGGMVSLTPPVGAPIWAQPEPKMIPVVVIALIARKYITPENLM